MVGIDVTSRPELVSRSSKSTAFRCKPSASNSVMVYYIEIEIDDVKYGFSGRFSKLRKAHFTLLQSLPKELRHKKYEQMNADLEDRIKALCESLPEFPSRKWFTNTKEEAEIHIRELELFQYYSELCQIEPASKWLLKQHEQKSSRRRSELALTFSDPKPVNLQRRLQPRTNSNFPTEDHINSSSRSSQRHINGSSDTMKNSNLFSRSIRSTTSTSTQSTTSSNNSRRESCKYQGHEINDDLARTRNSHGRKSGVKKSRSSLKRTESSASRRSSTSKRSSSSRRSKSKRREPKREVDKSFPIV